MQDKTMRGYICCQVSGEGTYRDRSEDGREGSDFNITQGNLYGNPIGSFFLGNAGFFTACMV